MLTRAQIDRCNSRLLEKLGRFLNETPDFIDAGSVEGLADECGLTRERAFSLLLSAALGLDLEANPEDKALYDNYFPEMLRRLDEEEFRRNPYYAKVQIPEARLGRWELGHRRYAPYEAFVRDDLEQMADGRVVPQLGYFEREFRYPVVFEDGREWMLVTPNEIETMRAPIERASGKVLAYGLGLGYFAYMVCEKQGVSSVTVVERDANVIGLFERFLLPQFSRPQKVEIVREDAFAHAERELGPGRFDLVFTDLWHDPSDGVESYLKMKRYESQCPRTAFMYWIEKTMKHYL
ncbi:MAG TPA: hypothetical protein DFS52_28170 [Myxococcales bacterium]|jgi:hypothetical protein|nr:hypothetical protein [Myxococcales bacterium]